MKRESGKLAHTTFHLSSSSSSSLMAATDAAAADADAAAEADGFRFGALSFASESVDFLGFVVFCCLTNPKTLLSI